MVLSMANIKVERKYLKHRSVKRSMEDRQADRLAGKTDRQTDRLAGKTDRQTDKQTDGQIDTD